MSLFYKFANRMVRYFLYGYKSNKKMYISHLKGKGMTIGDGVVLFSPQTTIIDESTPYMISIGNNVQITGGVVILSHDYGWSTLKAVYYDVLGSIRPVSIGNNVYIGMNAIILAGSKIGNNVIIGAGSVVSGTIPDNCVAVGNPCKVIYSLEKYHEKRKESQLNEAVEIINHYKTHFGDIPPREKLYEHFWLFENNEDSIPDHFKFQNNLMPGSEEKTWANFKSNEPMFSSYEELAEYAISYRETENNL